MIKLFKWYMKLSFIFFVTPTEKKYLWLTFTLFRHFSSLVTGIPTFFYWQLTRENACLIDFPFSFSFLLLLARISTKHSWIEKAIPCQTFPGFNSFCQSRDWHCFYCVSKNLSRESFFARFASSFSHLCYVRLTYLLDMFTWPSLPISYNLLV